MNGSPPTLPESSSESESAAPTVPESTERLRLRLMRTMLRTVADHSMIEEGDRILCAISGGKDSYTLLDLLWRARRKSPVDYEVIAFHLDQGQPGYDGRPLREWLKESGIPFEIHHENTYDPVIDHVGDSGKSYCGPCSRFRRGIVYTRAEALGCNKVALGHHREDTLETLLLNLFYGGKLQAMPASYRTNDDRFDVVRPLLECDEETIAAYARRREFPILPCNLCGSQDGLRRQQIKGFLARLENGHPDLRAVMMAALRNVRPTHLLDAEVREAWLEAADRFPPRR